MRKSIFNKAPICILLLVATTMIYCCIRIGMGVSESELYGTYIAKFSFGEVKLVLNSDGTYMQKATIKSVKEPILQEGKWKYGPTDQYVRLYGALAIADGFGELREDYDKQWNVVTPASKFIPWVPIQIGGTEGGSRYIKEN